MYHYSVDTFFSIYLIRSTTKTLERYQRSSFSPHDNAIKLETEVAIYDIYTNLFLPKCLMISFKLVMHMQVFSYFLAELVWRSLKTES